MEESRYRLYVNGKPVGTFTTRHEAQRAAGPSRQRAKRAGRVFKTKTREVTIHTCPACGRDMKLVFESPNPAAYGSIWECAKHGEMAPIDGGIYINENAEVVEATR